MKTFNVYIQQLAWVAAVTACAVFVSACGAELTDDTETLTPEESLAEVEGSLEAAVDVDGTLRLCLEEAAVCFREGDGSDAANEDCREAFKACKPQRPRLFRKARKGNKKKHDKTDADGEKRCKGKRCLAELRDCVTDTDDLDACVSDARECIADAIAERFVRVCAKAQERCAQDDAPVEICAKLAERCAEEIRPDAGVDGVADSDDVGSDGDVAGSGDDAPNQE